MNIAFVLVQSTIGHEMEVLNDLLKIELVKEAKGTFGYYDILVKIQAETHDIITCLLYTSPSPRDVEESRMPSSA